ncbi:MAG: hypothetical protein M1832_003381 [Thelocarpon impressellum]|nr:MAG: hypothetical protein M1832_003381 [Thelocarpon impressellum]
MDGHHADICKFSSADRDDYEQVAYNLVKLVEKAVSAEEESRQFEARHVESGARASSSKPFIVPYTDNSQFVGRDCTLAKLKCLMRPVEPDRRYLSRARAALFGLGGVGKSQIAIKYAYWLRKERPESSVFWVHASNVDRFRESFRQVAEVCKIPGYEEPKADILNLVKDWLKRGDGGEWLMIIDNADDIDMSFAQARTEDEDLSSDPQFVWAGLAQYIPDCSHGAILVTTRHERAGYDLVEERNLIEVSKMNETEASELLRKRLEGVMKEAEQLDVEVMKIMKEVQGARHPDTLKIMRTLASTYRHQGRLQEAEQLEVEVMEMTKEGLGALRPDTLTSMGNLALIYRKQRRLKKAEKLQVEVMETRKKDLGSQHPDTLTSMGDLATTYRHQGQSKEAEKLQVKVMNTRKELLGARHPDTLRTMGDLATTYRHQGRVKKAKQLEVEVMNITKKVQGARHPDTLRSMGNLAMTYRLEGRLRKAEVLQVEVMEMKKEDLGLQHPGTLTSMGDLAITYRRRGQSKEAEKLQVKVMNTRKELLGARHPDTLRTMGDLATTYRQQGQPKEAEELQVEIMEMRKEDLGPQHPDTLTSMENLAILYGSQGRSKEARSLDKDVKNLSKGAGDGSQVAGHSGEDETPDANSQDSTTPQDGEGAEEDGRDGRKRRTLVSRLLRCRKARESGVGPSSLRATKAGMRKN